MSIMECYNKITEKLTLLINKYIMTHGNDSLMTKESNEFRRQPALKVFVSGLISPYNNIISSMQPSDLPNALAKAQEIESHNHRAMLAQTFERNYKSHLHGNRPLKGKNQNVNSNNHDYKQDNNLRFPRNQNQGPNYQQNNWNYQKPEPMDVDTSGNCR